MSYFQDLPTELLIQIFEHCDISILYVLQQTCKRFHHIINESTTLRTRIPFVVTNQLQPDLRNRSTQLLTLKEKYRISCNWKYGIYKEISLLKERKMQMPHLVLTQEYLWLSKGNLVNAYKRENQFVKVNQPAFSVDSPNIADISKFVIKDNCLVSGQRDGCLFLWKPDTKSKRIHKCHESDIHSVDIKDNLLISGSRDQKIKLWHVEMILDRNYEPIFTYNMNDRVWSTAFSNQAQFLAVGTAGYNGIAPLNIFDLNKQERLLELSKNVGNGKGILQIKWETPYILLAAGYDRSISKWDIRTGVCEQSWEDPFYTTIYCFETDNYCTVLTGSQNNGRIILWDIRKKNYVQLYFLKSCKKKFFSSPVYSLSFDATCLFAATDFYLNILNFSVKEGISKNYGFLQNNN